MRCLSRCERVAFGGSPESEPPESEREREEEVGWYSAPVRWEPLEVSLWEGSLEHVNDAFVGVECVVAAEVYVSSSFSFPVSSALPLLPPLSGCFESPYARRRAAIRRDRRI